MQNKKRGIALVIAITMIISMFPVPAFANESNTVKYNISKPVVGIMNKINSVDSQFRRTYLRKADNNFNLAYKFTRTSSKNTKGADSTLSYNTSVMHYENGDFWNAYYKWDYQQKRERLPYSLYDPIAGNEGLGNLFSDGQVYMELSADLTADLHRNFWRHDKKILDRPQVSFNHTSERGVFAFFNDIYSSKDAPDESAVNFTQKKLLNIYGLTGFQLCFKNLGCECGSSKVSKVSIGLIDEFEPAIKSITASRTSGGEAELNGFRANETGYINLNFNEDIRFANDKVPTEPVMLNLTVMGAISHSEIKTGTIQAKLVELTGRRMTFKFTVPEKLGGENTNVYISGISNTQSWVNSNRSNTFPLVIFGERGNTLTLPSSLASIEDLTKTSSLITDISGNPVNWQQSSKQLSAKCFLDNVPPQVKSVDISGGRISKDSHQTSQADDWPEDIDRSTVFAGVGDSLTFSVKFSEVMKLPNDVENITAVLNAKKNETPISIKGKVFENIDDGVNGIKVSKIIFEPLKITENMKPNGDGSPLKITEIRFPSGTTDLRGNAIAGSITSITASSQQQFLDTQLPEAKLNLLEVDGKYTPMFYDNNDNNKKEFYLPIEAIDVDTIGSGAYASGSTGAMGSFAWLDTDAGDSYAFEYYVSASMDKPSNGKYVVGTTSTAANNLNTMSFQQMGQGHNNYIHIKLIDGVKYNIVDSEIVILPGDYAQNQGRNEFTLDYSADLVPPEIMSTGYRQDFDSFKDEGSMTVSVNIMDPSGTLPNNVEYQWVAKDAEPSGEWSNFTGEAENSSTPTLLKIKITKDGLEAERTIHEYDLLVRAKDKKGNLSEFFRIPSICDFTQANPNIEIKSGLDIPAKNIEISMELKPYSGSSPILQGLPATSVIMIKNPEKENEHFVIALSSKDHYLFDEGSIDDLFDKLKTVEGVLRIIDYISPYSQWYKADVSRGDNESYLFENSEELNEDDKYLLGSILNPLGFYPVNRSAFYYGDIELTVITAYGYTPQIENVWNYIGDVDLNNPRNVEFINKGCGENTAFYLDTADGVYLKGHFSGPVESESFYYTGVYTDQDQTEGGIEGQVVTPGGIQGEGYEIVEVTLPFTRIQGNINVQEFTLSLSSEYGDRYSHRIGVEFGEGMKADGTKGLLWKDEFIPGGEPKYLKNLDGAKIPFTLYNGAFESWGVKDIDFDSEDTYAALYYTEHGVSIYGGFSTNVSFSDGGNYKNISEMTPLVKRKLVETSQEQVFEVPHGITDKSGFYTLVVSVKPLNIYSDSQIKKFYNGNMFVNGINVVDGGVDYVITSVIDKDRNRDDILNNWVDAEGGRIAIGSAIPQEGFEINRILYIDTGVTDSIPSPLVYFPEGDLAFFGENDIYNGAFKIWNADSTTDGSVPSHLEWEKFYMRGSIRVDINMVNGVDELSEGSYGDGENIYLPIVAGHTNTICYQLWHGNGEVTPVKQFTVTALDNAPEYTLKADSLKEDGWVSSVTVSAEEVTALNGAFMFNHYSYDHGWGEKPEENMEPVTIRENGDYYFYVLDTAGNVNIQKLKIDWIDNEAPELEAQKISGSPGNEFHVKVTIEDNHDISEGKLYLSFDEGYSEILNGVANTEEKAIVSAEVPLAEGGTGVWNAQSPEDVVAGIYKTETVLSQNKHKKTVEIWGAFKYDENAQEEYTAVLTFSGADQAGNISVTHEEEYYFDEDTYEEYKYYGDPVEGTYLEYEAENTEPKFKNNILTPKDKVNLIFTAPVLVMAPNNSKTEYSIETDSVAVYSDGIYDISFMDAFGRSYTENVTVNAFGQFNIDVRLSETKPTQEDVVVAVEIPEGSTTVIQEIKGAFTDNSEINGILADDGKTASITMTDNGNVVVSIKNNNVVKERIIEISNIDSKLEEVTPYWHYSAGVPQPGETETSDVVTVGLLCGELLTGINGPTTYTFANGAKKGDTYIFEFEDQAKNYGSLIVELQHDVVVTEEDTIPPEYNAVLYSKLDYMNQQGESFNEESTSMEAAVNSLPPAQGYMLNFNIFDNSPVKLIVKAEDWDAPTYDGVSDTIDGVTVLNKSVIIEKNVAIKIYLLDNAGNFTELPMLNFINVDNENPTADVEYVTTTFYSTKGYLIPSEAIIVTNVIGVRQEDSGSYKDRYYHEYNDNEEFVFYFKDLVGNIGDTSGKVDWLDVSPPEVISVKWTPGQNAPPTAKTNNDIMAQVQFSKTIKELKAFYKGTDIEVSSDDVEITFIQGRAVVTYHNNADIELCFVASNGKDATFDMIKVDCIDKVAPVVTVENVAVSADKQSAAYTFKTSEDAYMAESSEDTVKYGKEFRYTFTANGNYDMHFTDKAGNSVVHKVTVNQLDKETMKVYFNTSATDEGQTENASELQLNTSATDKFYVKLTKDGKIKFDGKEVTALKGQWKEFDFTFSANTLFYTVVAEDSVRGTKVYNYLNVELPDIVPPAILFASPMVSVIEGSSAQYINDKLAAGVTASDNKDGGVGAAVVSVIAQEGGTPITISDDMKDGKYIVTYEAVDSAGNKSLATRMLRIYSKDTLNVLINGEGAEPGGTMVLNTGNITLTIENLPSYSTFTEPSVVFWKEGLKTVGQMKTRSNIAETDSITLTGTGFYTIYVRAQDRKDYITYVYIER